MGLKWVLTDFLNAFGSEWVEEMNFINNNRFYVLCRKSFVLQVAAVDPVKVARIVAETTAAGCATPKAALTYLMSNHNDTAEFYMDKCKTAYSALSIGGGTSGIAGGLCETFPMDPLARTASHFTVKSDTVPIFNKLGILVGHLLAGGHASFAPPTFVLRKQPFGVDDGVLAATETAALLMVLTTQARLSMKLNVKGDGERSYANSVIAPMVEALPRLAGTYTVTVDLTPAQIVFLAASTLAEYEPTETFQSLARIVVYGAALSDATHYSPKGFELMSVLNRGIGFAVWEKLGSKLIHYND